MARRAPLPTTDTIELDPARVERLRRLAVLLDDSIPIPGTRFRIGVESIIGLIPGAGDLAGGAFSLYILLQAARMGVPRPLLVRMGTNLVIDVVVGAVPVLGDLFDAGFKANLRNLALLERHADRPVASTRSSRRFVALLALLVGCCIVGAIAVLVWLVHLLLTRPVL
ncbi:MAG TPA: DUF4112 domain-containing protein [Gemmatimonadales bacterium]|jgi:hypothetical protein|nr:DUF4112 domain-containing protein [Gemmatimonadales bacterium]